jgi:tRNA pseudouridine38-40 synthase
LRSIALKIAYDGTHYAGWQAQRNAVAIQPLVEAALARVMPVVGRIVASSRTDAGVHALGQVACARTHATLPLRGVLHGVNRHLPEHVRICGVAEMPEDFHPQHHAMHKTYRYVIVQGAHRHPLVEHRAWWQRAPLNLRAMQRASVVLRGRHDFKAFAASHDRNRATVRRLSQVGVRRVSAATIWPLYGMSGGAILVTVKGDGFLKQMVRNIVGTLVDVGGGRRTIESTAQALASRDRCCAGRCAPAHGLYLVEVKFRPKIKWEA